MALTYTTIKKVAELTNLYSEITSEAVGTGDGSTVLFTLDNLKTINGSLTVYNAGTALTETTDYTVDYDKSEVTFVTSPTSGNAITADYWWSDVPSSVIDTFILRAEDIIDRRIGRGFYGTSSAVTEYYDGNALLDDNLWAYEGNSYREGYEVGFKNLQQSYYDKKTLHLKNYPIIAITSVTKIDDNDNETAVTSSQYKIYNDEGFIVFTKPSGVVSTQGLQNIKVVYTYGYATVPSAVEDLATKIAAVRLTEARAFGSPVPLDVMKSNIKALKEDIEMLFDTIGRKLELKVL